MNFGNQQLLIDSYSGFILNNSIFNETTSNGRKVCKFKGKFQEADAINKNHRSYPFDVLDENVKNLKEAIKARQLLGELDHPTDSIVHYANCSHVVTDLWWEGNLLMGEGEILATPAGCILKALLESNIPIGISSRGVGQGTTNEDGILVIGEGYKLITFDAVADPSTYHAFQERVVSRGNQNEARIQKKVMNSGNSLTKTERKGIDTVSNEALIACLEHFINSQAEKI